jgi:hypothetical protein
VTEHGDGAAEPHEIVHAGLRGAIAAMAMTGMREFTVYVGLVDQTPPAAILKQRARGLVSRVPKKKRRAGIELLHWGYGGVGGAAFAFLPESIRRQPWAGPSYGLVVWLAFELGIAPLLGLKQAKQTRLAERVALAADHLLYGFVLSETRRRPQE